MLSAHAPNRRSSEYKKQNWVEWKNKDKFKIMIGDFNIFLSIINKIIRPKINKELENLNNMSTNLT